MCGIANQQEKRDWLQIDQDVREREDRPTEALGCDYFDQSAGAEVERGDGHGMWSEDTIRRDASDTTKPYWI